jgi:hypothetical protein
MARADEHGRQRRALQRWSPFALIAPGSNDVFPARHQRCLIAVPPPTQPPVVHHGLGRRHGRGGERAAGQKEGPMLRMCHVVVVLGLGLGPLLGAACPGPLPRRDDPAFAGSTLTTTCDAAGVCSGTVDPALLDDATQPIPTGRDGNAVPGRHWFCRPEAGTPWNGRVVLHLVGTWSDPFDDHRFAEHACALGFAALVPMYDNRQPARETCGDDGDCYEAHRRAVVDGVDGAARATSPVDVDGPNSIRGRVATLLAHLAAAANDDDDDDDVWATIRDRLAAGDWRDVVLAGHSQGSGHALYLAREEVAERLVLLAGPSDRLGDGTADHAAVPWIDGMRTTPPRTPPSRIFGYLHEDDTLQVVPQVADNWAAIGVPDTTCRYVAAGGYAPSCRRILIPAAGCPGLQAHTTVTIRRWGPLCLPGVGGNTNQATWTHLLLATN